MELPPINTSTLVTTETPDTIVYYYQDLSEATVKLNKYGNLMVYILGVVGNILSLLVLRRKHYKQQMLTTYLRVLSVTDLLYIAFGHCMRTTVMVRMTWIC